MHVKLSWHISCGEGPGDNQTRPRLSQGMPLIELAAQIEHAYKALSPELKPDMIYVDILGGDTLFNMLGGRGLRLTPTVNGTPVER
jgi:hypothetical protein